MIDVNDNRLAGERDTIDIAALLGQARKASELLKALAHENRLIILCLLCKGEKSVSELEATMNMPQAAVSQQLARLRFDRLVETRRDGRMVYYSIADPQVAAVIMALYDIFCAPLLTAEQARTA
jgi:DNA-binding transcriptional ArsR family regulator